MLSRTSTSTSSSCSEYSQLSPIESLPRNSETLATATARVYHLPFGRCAKDWTDSGLAGTLVFGRSRATTTVAPRSNGPNNASLHAYWFRLIDPVKGLIWKHEIPSVFDYTLDKPFFHVFSGMSRMFGLRFDDDDEAAKVLKKVASHLQLKAPSSRKWKKPEVAFVIRRVTPDMISRPAVDTFVHVQHVGITSNGIEVKGDLPPEWMSVVKDLRGLAEAKSSASDVTFNEKAPLVADIVLSQVERPLVSQKVRGVLRQRKATV